MSTVRGWQILPLETPDIPKLLVKYHFGHDGYSIQLTDLCRIWEESLTKRECIQKALYIGSSIDPSQDDEQYQILLGKISSVLEQAKDTSLDLQGDGDGTTLTLTLSAPLPKPLQPLQWPVNLRQLPPCQVETHLVSPLVTEASHLQRQIQLLVNELQSKDRVISKICDRLETSGNDLTTVFPGVFNIKTSRKRGQREQLAAHVKGLADFDEVAWRERSDQWLKDEIPTDGEANAVLQKLSAAAPVPSNVRAEEGWWNDLKRQSQHNARRTEQSLSSKMKDSRHQSEQDDDSVMDEDFQRQATPPGVKRSHEAVSAGRSQPKEIVETVEGSFRTATAYQRDDESTTDDGEDLDAVPKRPSPLKSQKSTSREEASRSRSSPTPKDSQDANESTTKISSSKPQSRKLGAIGGHARPLALPTPEHATHDNLATFPKPSKRLGAIGGKKTEPQHNAPARPGGHKLGAIGDKRDAAEMSPSTTERVGRSIQQSDSASRDRTPEKQATPPPRETPQERADRKRDELKREMEKQAKVPVKKKRKF